MNALEDWISKLLDEDIEEINRKYWSANYAGKGEKEIGSLPGIDLKKYGASSIDVSLVQKLYLKIRNQKCEAAIWDAIIFHISEPLPTEIAHDLIDRSIIINTLGHTRQDDEVQWRLASLVDEALLNLLWDFFTKPVYEVAELQKLLSQHPDHLWLLDKWEHWALLSSSVREREKEIAFHRWVWEHPKRPADLPSPEQYLEIMADKERQNIEEQLRVEREEREEQFQLEREAELRRLKLEHIAKDTLDQSEIGLILSSQEPDMLLALANNSQIEVQWIQKLINCHHVKGARQIREAADSNINARKNSV